jgi:hypothetical protein
MTPLVTIVVCAQVRYNALSLYTLCPYFTLPDYPRHNYQPTNNTPAPVNDLLSSRPLIGLL